MSKSVLAVKAFYISLLFVLASAFAFSQKMYVSLTNGNGIKKVNVTSAGCISDDVVYCPGENYFAIALYKKTLYYASNTELFAATISGDTIKDCHSLGFAPGGMSSMTVDNSGIIYSSSLNVLYRNDLSTGMGFEVVGVIPFVSAGDLIFFEGELYMASLTGIVKVNIADPSLSTMHIPMSSRSVFGMAVLSVDCNLNKPYAFETTDAGNATNIIELDLTNRVVVGVACTVPFGVADGASEVEGGAFAGISINEIKVQPQCESPGKGKIRVIREPGQAVYTYLLNGTVLNTTGVFEYLDPGTYRIEISTPGGCYLDTTADLPVFDPTVPVITEHFIAPDCVGPGKAWFTISPDNGFNQVIFKNDTLSASYQFTELNEGVHHFIIVDQYFCQLGTKDIVISPDGSCDTVYFPTAFTPDNNGRNDLFRGNGNRTVKNYQLTIYNRWGQTVFTTNNILSGWNGKSGEVEQAPGVYVWVASYSNKAGQLRKRKGTMVLLR